MVVIFVQFANAQPAISVIPSGKLTEVSAIQFSNALALMYKGSVLGANVKFVRPTQFLNA